jgi:hypothetical protein
VLSVTDGAIDLDGQAGVFACPVAKLVPTTGVFLVDSSPAAPRGLDTSMVPPHE